MNVKYVLGYIGLSYPINYILIKSEFFLRVGGQKNMESVPPIMEGMMFVMSPVTLPVSIFLTIIGLVSHLSEFVGNVLF